MAKWVAVAREADFEDQPVKMVIYDGERIALFRLEDGIYAIDDECSHATASLAEGRVDDHIVECPRHGARFDIRTGKHLSFPAVTPVKSYPVKVENGNVYIYVED
ncbi:MAG: non-heme iron oxygenase ferredoxin subunit [Calditrichaeota bacterium]|nr:non-heme iron oxygenase ferredoxin subunit [Calditrichota bacterium]